MEAGISDIARLRREDRRRTIPDDRALIGVEDLDDFEGIALDIAVIGDERREIDDDRLILLRAEDAERIVGGARTVRIGDRRVVDGGDVEGDRPGRGLAAIAHRVGEADRPVDVLVGHELPAPIGKLQNPAARRGARDRLEGDRVAVSIAVIAQKLRRGELERHVLHRREDVGCRDRSVVGRDHRDLDLAGARAVRVIGDDVFEGRLALEVVVRREQNVRAVEGDRAVAGIGDADKPDRVAVDIEVVRKQRLGIDHERRVFDRGYAILDRGGRIVERRDMNHGRSCSRSLAIVGHDVAEGIIAGIGAGRCVDDVGTRIAVETLAQYAADRDAVDRARDADFERRQNRKRDIAGERAGRAVDRQPGRQGRAIGKRRGPDCAGGLAEAGRRRDRDMAELDRDRAIGRLPE